VPSKASWPPRDQSGQPREHQIEAPSAGEAVTTPNSGAFERLEAEAALKQLPLFARHCVLGPIGRRRHRARSQMPVSTPFKIPVNVGALRSIRRDPSQSGVNSRA
jgi:hypothetical protein